jgi:hypothetical protein
MWTPIPDVPSHLTLGEKILVASFWLGMAYIWLWTRRRAKRLAKPAPPDGMSETPTSTGDRIRLRLWVYWPSFLARAMLALLLTVGVVSSVVDLIRSIPIGR